MREGVQRKPSQEAFLGWLGIRGRGGRDGGPGLYTLGIPLLGKPGQVLFMSRDFGTLTGTLDGYFPRLGFSGNFEVAISCWCSWMNPAGFVPGTLFRRSMTPTQDVTEITCPVLVWTSKKETPMEMPESQPPFATGKGSRMTGKKDCRSPIPGSPPFAAAGTRPGRRQVGLTGLGLGVASESGGSRPEGFTLSTQSTTRGIAISRYATTPQSQR